MSDQLKQDTRIVVGVDGSPSSKAALAWAVRQAEQTGGSVEAVIAWHYPAMASAVPLAPIGENYTADYGEYAAQALNGAVLETVDPDGPVKVSSTVREGNAAQVLLDESAGADLLVVGSRGHGGFTEALLGSVSQACVHHARCPVVIVREPSAHRPAAHSAPEPGCGP
jgi:nucleotide-binding universal stress UspA family protein